MLGITDFIAPTISANDFKKVAESPIAKSYSSKVYLDIRGYYKNSNTNDKSITEIDAQ